MQAFSINKSLLALGTCMTALMQVCACSMDGWAMPAPTPKIANGRSAHPLGVPELTVTIGIYKIYNA